MAFIHLTLISSFKVLWYLKKWFSMYTISQLITKFAWITVLSRDLARYYVLHRLPNLTFLDSRPVTQQERKEAKRVGAFMRVVRPDSQMVCALVWRTMGVVVNGECIKNVILLFSVSGLWRGVQCHCCGVPPTTSIKEYRRTTQRFVWGLPQLVKAKYSWSISALCIRRVRWVCRSW